MIAVELRLILIAGFLAIASIELPRNRQRFALRGRTFSYPSSRFRGREP